MKNTCTIRSIDPKLLTQSQYKRLNEVTQDMWAEGIWEFVQCNCCQKMMSKQDIFWHLKKEIYDETVESIMNLLGIDKIPCIDCQWDTKFIYGKEHVNNIKERLMESQDSFLVVCENQKWEIVWYEEWYIDTIENIFQRELAYHYSEIGIEEIKKRIDTILGYTPETMLVLSSIGLLQKYVSFFTLFEILKNFALTIPEKYNSVPGITELDKNNNLNMVSEVIGSISLWIHDDPILKNKITNTGNWYQSNLTLVPEAWERYKHYLSWWAKNFLKFARKKS